MANCMSGSVLVEGVRDGVNTCSWWLGLGMITAGPGISKNIQNITEYTEYH